MAVSYPNLAKELTRATKVLLNNGLMIFTVTEIDGDDVVCRVDAAACFRTERA